MIRNNQNAFILFSILLLTLALIAGCNHNKVIEEEKFIKIFADMIIAKDTTSARAQSKDDIITNVLTKYNVTVDDYNATIQFYNQESERWENFFTKAMVYLEAKRQKVVK